MVDIRPAKLDDLEELGNLWLQFIQDPDGSDLNIQPCDENKYRWINWVRKTIVEGKGGVLIADVGGRIAGYLFYGCSSPLILKEDICRIFDLYVKPEFRGRGIGKRLLEAAINEIKSRGIKTIRIDVISSNERAINLYRKFGFEDFIYTLELRL